MLYTVVLVMHKKAVEMIYCKRFIFNVHFLNKK
jgi:hypothetical protein